MANAVKLVVTNVDGIETEYLADGVEVISGDLHMYNTELSVKTVRSKWSGQTITTTSRERYTAGVYAAGTWISAVARAAIVQQKGDA